MSTKPIIIISGEPYGVFNEIFFKIKKKYRFKRPILLIGSKEIILKQMKQFKLNFDLNLIDHKILNLNKIKKVSSTSINLIDVNLPLKKDRASKKVIRNYIENCFKIGSKIILNNECAGLINGPINKKTFLNFTYPGVTEYLADKFNVRNYAMLIYNKKLSVCPITTHLPLKNVHKHISKRKIIDKVTLVNNFYKKMFKKKPRMAITGLNPHCESPIKNAEEKKFIKPAIESLKKSKIFLKGPLSTDTLFMKSELEKFDVIIGMYHDQVLTPMKALYGFDAINLTLGLPFLRVSPDHGPNEKMFGKNLSNPYSLLQAIKFLDN